MKNKGFTMVEMLLVTTVLIIVVAMSFPEIENFIFLGKEKQEEQNINEIVRAMESYAEEARRLPDIGTWAEDLSAYTHLSEDEIRLDAWGNARVYLRVISPEVEFKNGSFFAHYAIVYGYGSDGCLGMPAACDPNTPNPAFNPVNFSRVDEFSTVAADVGDFIGRYSDYKDKIEAYNTTTLRLEKISLALSKYADRVYNEAIIAGLPAGTNYVYYPPSDVEYATELVLYSPVVRNDVVDGGINIVNNPVTGAPNVYTGGGSVANDNRRRASMMSLMRFLGLPDEYCCNALETYDSGGGVYVDKPFYYYSNPRKRTGLGCDPARRNTLASIKLPARISTQDRSGACG